MTTVCPRARAAFSLELDMPGRALPKGLVIEVGFGGAESESYSLLKGNGMNDVLCCSTENAVSLQPQSCGRPLVAADGAAAEADAAIAPTQPAHVGGGNLRCEVWTNGAAELKVTAYGYEPIDRVLVAEKDETYMECSVWQTVPVALTLELGDAGAPPGFN
jgi:hypothetical protein